MLAVVQGFKMLTCTDEQVRRIAQRSLRADVQTKLRGPIEYEDLAKYLNGECNGVGGFKSFWARVRRSTMVNGAQQTLQAVMAVGPTAPRSPPHAP